VAYQSYIAAHHCSISGLYVITCLLTVIALLFFYNSKS